MSRARMRYVDMSLGPDPDAEPYIVEVECTSCAAASAPAPERVPGEMRDRAEEWALRHTGRADADGRHHTGFRVTVTMFWRVTPHEEIDPPAGPEPARPGAGPEPDRTVRPAR
ncbi:hypothetical protein [Streptomyces sp. NPDC018031]|uniref:DUF7848 domain-containing protein n=1 Tax=Streptomyces sp. NPDC018031 TaxID=3365033 RepID=UPI003788CE76